MKIVALGEITSDIRPGFASGESVEDGIVQVRMNNISSEGSLVWDKVRRVPHPKKLADLTAMPGDILFNATNSPELVGKAAIFTGYNEPVTFSNHFFRLRLDTRIAEPGFVIRVIHDQWSHRVFENMCKRWVNQAAVSKDDLLKLEIPLPLLDEQRRIAAILDQADALRRARRRAIERLNDLGQAIFYKMFGDPEKVSKYQYPLVKLSELCRKITDGTHQPPKWAPTGVPFIFVSNVRNQKITLDTQKFVSVETYQELTRNTSIEKGDVLYTAVGSYGNAAAVITDTAFVFQRHIAHIKPNPKKLNPIFLSYLLESPYLRRQADNNAKGIAQKTVTLGDIKNFNVPLVPIAQQEQFALSLETMHILMKQFDCAATKTDTLFTSLQHRAFRGEL